MHLEGKHPGAKSFHLPGSDKTSRLFKADLDEARAEWLNDAKTPQERSEREGTEFLVYVNAATKPEKTAVFPSFRADGEGFEPPVGSLLQQFSRLPP